MISKCNVILTFYILVVIEVNNTLHRLLTPGQQGEASSSFLATLASSSSEEMEAELQERVESSCKQAGRVVDVYTSLKATVEQLKKTVDSETGED